jgi:predicted permease
VDLGSSTPLKIQELWRLSRTSYNEVAFRANKQSSGGVSGLGGPGNNVSRQFKMIMRSTKVSKFAFAIFGSIGAAIPFLDDVVVQSPESLLSAIILSLGISLAYVIFYSLQVLPEFTNSEAFSVLYGLPLKERDFSLIAVFSFIRTFDYLVIGTTLIQVLALWFLTGSIVATLLMIIGAIINAVFAAAIALWLAGLFYRKISHSTTRSKSGIIGRLIFLIVWGFAAMSIGFLFNILSYLLPFVYDIIGSGNLNPGRIAISLLHPFAIGISISAIIYPSDLLLIPPTNSGINAVLIFIPFFASLCYAFLALFIGKRTFATVTNIAHSKNANFSIRMVTKNLALKLHRPLFAQIIKDLRLASKNPSMAFLYALPVFVVFMLAVITSQFPIMHASSVIVSTVVGCSFTIMICTTLLNTEGTGLEYSFSLPIKVRQIIDAKTLVATLMFVPVPIALIFLGLSKQLTSYYLLLIPVVEVISIYASCMSEITVFFGSGKSRGFSAVAGAGIGRLVLSLSVALALFVIPLGAYAIEFVISANHAFSILTMLAIACVEFFAVFGMNRKITSVEHLDRSQEQERTN